MTALALSLLAQLWPYILGAGAVIAGLWTAYSKGQAKQKAAQAAADAKATTEAQKIDDAVAGRAPDNNRGRLAKWSKS